MVSGYDKTPPDDQHEPDFGGGVRLALIVVFAIVAFVTFGWLIF